MNPPEPRGATQPLLPATAARPAAESPRIIVGIGASAGGLESMQVLLPTLPTQQGLCYVVLQHTTPQYRSLLADVLSKHTRMPVRELRDGDRPTPNEVLVTPSNAHVEYDGQAFRLSAPAPHAVPKPSINLFLVSLALHGGPRAIGVILSGTGSDGALGMRQIKSAGGHLIVQDPASALYTGMPEATLRTAEPHFVLPPTQIGSMLTELARRHWPGAAMSAPEIADAERLQQLLQQLRQHSGIDFGHYKTGTLQRRISRRMLACGMRDLQQYLAFIEQQPAELDALLHDVLISVTAFFRDTAVFATLTDALCDLILDKPSGAPVRIWVPGCATGEEAYSIIIALMERLGPDIITRRRVQLFATDVDLAALAVARRAVYPHSSLDALPRELVSRYFMIEGNQGELVRSVRELVVFSRHDLTRDPPFPRQDLVSCRNVLIYLKSTAQARVMNALRYALNPGGLLLIGRAESLQDRDRWFLPLDAEAHLYRRNDARAPSIAGLIETTPATSRRTGPPTPHRRPPPPDHEVELLRHGANLYLPPCVLLDARFDILQVHGDTSPLLRIPPGEQTLNLLQMAQPSIQEDLRILCIGASTGTRTARLTLGQGRERQRWRAMLHSFVGERSEPLHLIAFERIERASLRNELRQNHRHHEAELASLRERMRLLIEQLETSNEEMQALNEEAQAANEELQAGNEELEAANEELLAANQELGTVNAELNHQWQIHRQLSEELQSVQNNVDLPVLMIDAEHLLRRFNDAAARLFHLRDGSIGLPLATMRCPDGMVDLLPYVERSLQSASPLLEALPPTRDGREYMLHLAHNVVDGQRHGIVMTLVDNTDLVRAQRSQRQMEQRVLALLTHGSSMVAIKDLSGRYEFCNAQYAHFFGVTAEALLGRTDAQVLGQPVAQQLRRGDLEVLSCGDVADHEEQFTLAGQRRTWLVCRFPLLDDQQHITALCLQATDLTSLRKADEQLRIADQILATTTEGVLILDPQLNIVRVNQAFTTITGYTREQVLGRRPNMLSSGRHDKTFYQAMWTQILEQRHWQGEVWNRRADGSHYLEWLSINVLLGDDGQVTHYVGVFSDISSIAETRARMEALATHDTLTSLPNRTLLQDRLGHAIDAAQRSHSELALCFIDLDNFKTINDSLGHEAGDEMLCLAARRISNSVRVCDTVARLGGDEFVLLLENTSRHECLTSVQRLSQILAETCHIGGTLLSAAASIGVAIFPDDGGDAATLMRNADAAMYRAKQAGKGRFEFYSHEVGESARNRLAVESGLRQALGNGELSLVYQPQFNLRTLEVVGVEALLRWRSSQGTSIAPSMFLPIAEESHLIEQIGDWVIARACAQMADWRTRGIGDFHLSVNVSPRQLRDSRLVETVRQHLLQHHLPAERLVLELTESALAQDLEGTSEVLHRLKNLGCQISLDDFGTGHSSLARLRHLPLHELKIDRSFIHDITQARNDRRIVNAVVELASALELRTIAEGIETLEQLEHLRKSPADLIGQGYVFAQPMAPADLERWLLARRHQEGAGSEDICVSALAI